MHTITTFLPEWEANISAVSEASFNEDDSPVVYGISRVGSQNIERFSARVLLTNRQLSVYEHFIDQYLSSGTAWFRGPYETSTGVVNGVIRIVNGDYSISYRAVDLWEVSHDIEVWKDASFA